MITRTSVERWCRLLLFILVCLSVGWLGGVFTESSRVTWYANLQKPPLNPPDWVFAPVWAILYIFMAIAGWRIWHLHTPARNGLMALFAIQLLLNALWSFLFFGLCNSFAAFVDIILLWIVLLALIEPAWSAEWPAGFFLTPYFLWVSFAVYLNAGIWWINS